MSPLGENLRDDYWEWGLAVGILKFLNGANSGCLANSSRGGQQHVIEQEKHGSTSAVGTSYFPPNVPEIVNDIRI